MLLEVGRDHQNYGTLELSADGTLRVVQHSPDLPPRSAHVLDAIIQAAQSHDDPAAWLARHVHRYPSRMGLWVHALDGELPRHDPHAGRVYPESGPPYRA